MRIYVGLTDLEHKARYHARNKRIRKHDAERWNSISNSHQNFMPEQMDLEHYFPKLVVQCQLSSCFPYIDDQR